MIMILYPYKISAVLSAAPSSPSFNHFVFVVNKKEEEEKLSKAKADIIFGLFQIISQINVFIFKKNKPPIRENLFTEAVKYLNYHLSCLCHFQPSHFGTMCTFLSLLFSGAR